MLPYKEIPDSPNSYTPSSIITRLIDGLGYRFYWATKDLNSIDLAYKPSPEAKSSFETMEHLFGLSETILNVAQNKPNVRPYRKLELDFESMRTQTLHNLKEASIEFESIENLDNHPVVFQINETEKTYSFWHLINGQISDSIYHVGQVVSFRRTTGNPIDSKVNVFLGK